MNWEQRDLGGLLLFLITSACPSSTQYRGSSPRAPIWFSSGLFNYSKPTCVLPRTWFLIKHFWDDLPLGKITQKWISQTPSQWLNKQPERPHTGRCFWDGNKQQVPKNVGLGWHPRTFLTKESRNRPILRWILLGFDCDCWWYLRVWHCDLLWIWWLMFLPFFCFKAFLPTSPRRQKEAEWGKLYHILPSLFTTSQKLSSFPSVILKL